MAPRPVPTAVGPFVTRQRLILASGSPRRQSFLLDLGLDFSVIVPDVEEQPRPGETPLEFARRAARDKAVVVSAQQPDAWILGADTVVVRERQILGKPKNAADALRMLMLLAGRTHEVHTGFCLHRAQDNATEEEVVTTAVVFSAFSRQQALAYINTGEPLDKAGSYGIQGKGGFLVQSINGSYSNVVGLPLTEVVLALTRHGVITPAG